jgi:hypothetical protein
VSLKKPGGFLRSSLASRRRAQPATLGHVADALCYLTRAVATSGSYGPQPYAVEAY